jgi:hypothetical protein
MHPYSTNARIYAMHAICMVIKYRNLVSVGTAFAPRVDQGWGLPFSQVLKVKGERAADDFVAGTCYDLTYLGFFFFLHLSWTSQAGKQARSLRCTERCIMLVCIA